MSVPRLQIGELEIRAAQVCHPGPTVGFRIREGGASLAYLPDHEPALGSIDFPREPEWTSGFELAADASLLIHDAQYDDAEYADRVGWGHSALRDLFAFATRRARRARGPVPLRPESRRRGAGAALRRRARRGAALRVRSRRRRRDVRALKASRSVPDAVAEGRAAGAGARACCQASSALLQERIEGPRPRACGQQIDAGHDLRVLRANLVQHRPAALDRRGRRRGQRRGAVVERDLGRRASRRSSR